MVSPSRRERLRDATVADIRRAARAQLAAGGPAAISLRAIARDLGMTAPAIYRYFPSLDALIAQVVADLLTELREMVVAARDRVPVTDPVTRLAEMGRAYRRWALANRREFSLVFGERIPALEAMERCGTAAHEASIQLGQLFLAELLALWRRYRLDTSGRQPSSALTEALSPEALKHRGDVPVEVVHAYLSGWTRLYGVVAMEVFGQVAWIVTDPEPLFEHEFASYLRELGVPYPDRP
ncbi:MAG TPA: TetR/AcrR family transcriptional regulator [Natronosporangium sp.]|nr:TetR/AcrR family transcriptional regulator [Natronosporangium sp.]